MLLWYDQIKVISVPVPSNTCHFSVHLRVIVGVHVCVCRHACVSVYVL